MPVGHLDVPMNAGASPSMLLMPLALRSLLGGTVTLMAHHRTLLFLPTSSRGALALVRFCPRWVSAVTVAGYCVLSPWWAGVCTDGAMRRAGKSCQRGDYVTNCECGRAPLSAGGHLHHCGPNLVKSDDSGGVGLDP